MAKKKAKKPAKKAAKKAVKKAKKAAPKKASKKAAKKAAKKVVKKAASKPAKKAAKKASAKKAAAATAPKPEPKRNTVNVYLTFNGNCEDAFNFYKSVFGGEFGYVGRFSEMPPQEGQTLSEEDSRKLMHISLPISKETVLMGSDTTSDRPVTAGDNFALSVNATSTDEADRLFAALSNGGSAIMPMANQFWNSYFGMLVDPYGVSWMVNAEAKKD